MELPKYTGIEHPKIKAFHGIMVTPSGLFSFEKRPDGAMTLVCKKSEKNPRKKVLKKRPRAMTLVYEKSERADLSGPWELRSPVQ